MIRCRVSCTILAVALPGLAGVGIAGLLPGPYANPILVGTGVACAIVLVTAVPQHLVCRATDSIAAALASTLGVMFVRLIGIVACGFAASRFGEPRAYLLSLVLCAVTALLLDAVLLAVTKKVCGENADARSPDG